MRVAFLGPAGTFTEEALRASAPAGDVEEIPYGSIYETVMAVHEGNVLQYAWDHPQVLPIRNPLPYWIALPTTSGRKPEREPRTWSGGNPSHARNPVRNPTLTENM